MIVQCHFVRTVNMATQLSMKFTRFNIRKLYFHRFTVEPDGIYRDNKKRLTDKIVKFVGYVSTIMIYYSTFLGHLFTIIRLYIGFGNLRKRQILDVSW